MKRLILKPAVCIMFGLVLAAFCCGCGSETGSAPENADTAAEDTAASSGASLEASVDGLDRFMGGWGSLDSPYSDCDIVFFGEEDGKLKVEFAAISGGGYYVVFEPEDISVEGETITCANGSAVFEGANQDGIILNGKPSAAAAGDYTFRITDAEGNPADYDGEDYNYTKVGDSKEELDNWINEHHEPL